MSGSALIVFVLTAACSAPLSYTECTDKRCPHDAPDAPLDRLDNQTSLMQGVLVRHGAAALQSTAIDLHQPQAQERQPPILPPQQPRTTEEPAVPNLPWVQQAERTLRRISSFDMRKEILRTLGAATRTFLPQFRPELHAFVKALLTVFLGMAWFGIYLHLIYVDDRSESLDAWKEVMERDADEHVSPRSTYTPDFMLVFHHPGFVNDDKAATVSAASLERIFVNNEDCVFTKLEQLKDAALEGDRRRSSSLGLIMRTVSAVTGGTDEEEEVKPQVEIAHARQAFLQDMCRNLPLWGFDVTVFSSIDGDELYVCVSLNRKDSIHYYLKKNNTQVQLRREIVARLGVHQNPDDPASSPPSVSYDEGMVERLHDIGILIRKEGTELFKSFPRSGKVTVVNTKDCIWTIRNEIEQHVDLCAAKQEGLLVTWYPVHNPNQVALFRTIWANWRSLLDLTFRQPIPLVRDYFSPRIAFLFEWNGVYCKGLLVLMTVALAQVSLVHFCRDLLGIDLLRSRQVLGFSIVLVVWSKITQNLYVREQNFFLELWNIRPHGGGSQVMRPHFKGELGPSEVDATVKELQFSKKVQFLRSLLTTVATVGFCCLVALCIFMWLLIFDGKMGLLSSVMLSIQIKVFEFVFTMLAAYFTEYENHKYEDDHHNSLLWKLFLFNFVNNYSAFFFMTVRNAWMGCLDDCLFILRRQVTMCLCVLGICSILQMLVAHLKVKFALYWELRQLQKKGQEVPKRSVLEEQSKYAVIDGALELQIMMTLVIALGHVLLFGGVSAAVVPYCFIVFTVQLRAFAVLLTTCSQRPFPYTSQGIGHWQHCITFLTCLGVPYAGFLFVAYGEAFRGTTALAKMTGVVLFCLFAFMLWAVIDLIFPPDDRGRSLMCARRAHVARKLVSRVGAKGLASMRETTLRQMTVSNADLINDGEWDSIQTLAAMPIGPMTTPREPSETISEVTPRDSIPAGSTEEKKKRGFFRRVSSRF